MADPAVIPLKPDEQVTIPPKGEVKGELLWHKLIQVQLPGPTHEATFIDEYVPMTTDGVLVQRDADGNDTTKRMETNEFFADCEKCPELLAIKDAVVNGTLAIQAYFDKKAAAKAEADAVIVVP